MIASIEMHDRYNDLRRKLISFDFKNRDIREVNSNISFFKKKFDKNPNIDKKELSDLCDDLYHITDLRYRFWKDNIEKSEVYI